MANLKRAAALTLSAAMFLQPMTASAATWGNIMSAIRNGQKYTDGKTSAEVNEQGELTVSGGSLDDGVIMRGDNDGFKWVSSIILKNVDVKWENASGVGIYVEKSGTEDQKYRFTVGENATVRGMVIINAGNQKTYSKGTEIELNIEKNAKIRIGNVQVNAINGGSVTSTNQGWIQGEYMGCADGADSTADLTNLEGGQIAALPIWEKPGEYTVLIKCVGENDEVTYEAVTILVEEEKPAEPMDTSEEAFRHEMEMKRQEEAIGGVYGSPYWVKQLYLGYHSYNLRLFVGETRENFREKLSWSADGSKSVSLRVNDENPEKLTMRFDEKVLEVLERTNITTVTLLNRSGAAVMQYNVSDLRAAYDQYGLSDADQLVVGGMDDDVMKIGADGQLVPVE